MSFVTELPSCICDQKVIEIRATERTRALVQIPPTSSFRKSSTSVSACAGNWLLFAPGMATLKPAISEGTLNDSPFKFGLNFRRISVRMKISW